MEELFPGLQDAVLADGGLLLDMAKELAWYTPWGWGVRFSSPLLMLACSRALLEWRIRRALEDGVVFMSSTRVQGLLLTGGRVCGVRTGNRSIEANLVVDASGRGSHAPDWLGQFGYPPPRETTVNAFLGYASRFYRPAPDASREWKGMYIQAAPPEHPRVGVLLPIEGGLWHVTLGGGDRQYPPSDDHGFLEFARSLRTTAVYDALRSAEPCSPIYTTRSTENRRRHFESVQLPEGFVVTGDAACAFNPVYGQGMTTAALAAQALGTTLEFTQRRTGRPHGDGLTRRFQAALARVNQDPWALAIGEDLRYRGTVGARADIRTRLLHGYLDAVGQLTTSDPFVRSKLLRAFHMIAPPSSLFVPAVMWRMFRAHRRRAIQDGGIGLVGEGVHASSRRS
jgi:2-polyprenyl-6-methoxyphenol hydroxylase-like FAD-dependent oxidoreductase